MYIDPGLTTKTFELSVYRHHTNDIMFIVCKLSNKKCIVTIPSRLLNRRGTVQPQMKMLTKISYCKKLMLFGDASL